LQSTSALSVLGNIFDCYNPYQLCFVTFSYETIAISRSTTVLQWFAMLMHITNRIMVLRLWMKCWLNWTHYRFMWCETQIYEKHNYYSIKRIFKPKSLYIFSVVNCSMHHVWFQIRYVFFIESSCLKLSLHSSVIKWKHVHRVHEKYISNVFSKRWFNNDTSMACMTIYFK